MFPMLTITETSTNREKDKVRYDEHWLLPCFQYAQISPVGRMKDPIRCYM